MKIAMELLLVSLVVAVLYASLWGFLTLCELLVIWRQSFREEFADTWHDFSWQESSFSGLKVWEITLSILVILLFFLVWLVVELLAALGQVIVNVAAGALAYSVAKDVRDWWHEGKSR